MPFFNYRAVDRSGKTISGSMTANEESDVKGRLIEDGLIPVKIVRANELSEKINSLIKQKVNIKVVALFCRQLYIIVNSGVNILNGLDILRFQMKDKLMKNIVGKMYNEVQKGRSLSESMNDMSSSLPSLLVNMVSVGEISGNLDEILKNMSNYYERDSFMREKLKSAMTYPIILISVAVIMVIFFINFVLPEVVKMITESGGELPALTKTVLGAVDAVKNYYLIFFGAIAAIYIALKTAIPKEKFRIGRDRLLNAIPVAGTSIKNVVTARFLRTVSMMLKGGIPLLPVLESVEKVLGNGVAEIGIRAAIEGVQRGERLGENIASCRYFDPIVIHMIDIGEETGQLDSILEVMADYYDKEAEAWLMKMMALIEPVFTIIVGVVIGILIISMMLPMFSMLSNINTQ